jgi:O-antigen ligase
MMAFPMRFWVEWGPFSSFSISDIAIITAILFLIANSILSAKIIIGSKLILSALLTPLIFGILSLFWTTDPIQTFKTLIIYAEAIAAYLAAIFLFRSMEFKSIAFTTIIFLHIIIISAVFSYFGVPGFNPQIPPDVSSETQAAYLLTYKARFSHPFIGLSNNFASVLAFYPLILASCSRITGSKAYIWTLSLTLAAILATQSRGVLLAFLVGLIAYLSKKKFKSYLAPRMTTCLFLVSLGILLYFHSNPTSLTYLKDRFTLLEIYTRIEIYKQTINAIIEAPLLGHGAGVPISALNTTIFQSVHNTYLEQLFYYGLFGGIPVIMAIISLPILINKMPVLNYSAWSIRRSVSFSVLIQLILSMMHPSFEGSLLRVMFSFSLGIGISLITAANRKSIISSNNQY